MASTYPLPQPATSNETPSEAPRLLDRMRFTRRAKQYSSRTEQAYVHWVRRFILLHEKRHPEEIGGVAREKEQASKQAGAMLWPAGWTPLARR
ncbi:MAG: phage integrase N-terminal SAM-like domain-containing protein [Pirellulales bacterium]|nr:phage integrase N-terminal SAM-like domain-containing protein [Pirellulales bacterium]